MSYSGLIFCALFAGCLSPADQTALQIDTSQSQQSADADAARTPLMNILQKSTARSEARVSHEMRSSDTDNFIGTPQTALIRTALDSKSRHQGHSAAGVPNSELGPTLDGKPPQLGFTQAMNQLRLKQYDKALEAIKKLELQQPKNPVVQNVKGGVYIALEDNASAHLSFEKALFLPPAYFPAAENLARLDLQENHPELAKSRCEGVLHADKKNATAMIGLGNLAQVAGYSADATIWFEKAAAENPAAVGPALVLGAQYLRSGAKDRGQVLAQQLLVTNGGDAAVLDLLGQSQAANNDFSGSLLTFEKLASLNPTTTLPQIRIANVYLALQNQGDATATQNKALVLQPDNLKAQAALLALHGRAGEFDAAIKIARQVQNQRPKEPISYVMEGDTFMLQKKPELAVEAYEKAAAQRRSGLLLIKQQAALLSAGSDADADADADAMAVQWPQDNPQDGSVQVNLANGYLARKQPKAAIEQHEAAPKTVPQSPEIPNNLAFAYHQTNDDRDIGLAERALKLAPNSPGIMDALGWILVGRGNDARGLGLLQKASAMSPGKEKIRFHLAVGLVNAGNKVGAKKELTALAESKTFAAADEAKRLLGEL